MRLKDQVALITGAGSGIGEAAALLMAKEGAKIAALGHTDDELQEVVKQIKDQGHEALKLVADIAKNDQMEAAVRKIEQQWGRLDIVFANAGINGVWAAIEKLQVKDWDETIEVNLRGTFLTIKHSVELLKKRGGSVIITSSVNGTRIFSNTGATAYACTKAAQVALAKMLALELAKHKIRVNVICPGAIDTSIEENMEERGLEKANEPVEFPEGKVPLTRGEPGTSQQVAKLVLFLASHDSDHITGTEIWIDGAESLLMG